MLLQPIRSPQGHIYYCYSSNSLKPELQIRALLYPVWWKLVIRADSPCPSLDPHPPRHSHPRFDSRDSSRKGSDPVTLEWKVTLQGITCMAYLYITSGGEQGLSEVGKVLNSHAPGIWEKQKNATQEQTRPPWRSCSATPIAAPLWYSHGILMSLLEGGGESATSYPGQAEVAMPGLQPPRSTAPASPCTTHCHRCFPGTPCPPIAMVASAGPSSSCGPAQAGARTWNWGGYARGYGGQGPDTHLLPQHLPGLTQPQLVSPSFFSLQFFGYTELGGTLA